MSSFPSRKYRALVTYVGNLRRRYRDQYSQLYPHGILREIVREFPQYKGIEIFVETGTFKGKTARQESQYFREVYTIELNENLFNENFSKFKIETPNVKSFLGDSAEILPQVLSSIHEPCMIFLDAHWSGDNRVDWNSSNWTGYGVNTSYRGDVWPPSSDQQCPLIDEANAISDHLKFPCVLIIDDWAVVGTKDRIFEGEDWSTISLEKIITALGEQRILTYFTRKYKGKVRMIILLNKNEQQ